MRLEKFNTSIHYKGLKTFDCGNEMINRFVKKSLKKRVKRHFSQAYVLLENDTFIGFYTLETFSIAREIFESYPTSSTPPPLVSVIKLGMLGVDRSFQGKGIGRKLLRDALVNVVDISEIAGCMGLYLLAEEEAIPFYEQLGFEALKEQRPLPMFLSIETIIQSIKG
jgi:GNAT superfamily N-acetyltransferase